MRANNENNQVSLKGTIDSKFQFSHTIFGENFYTVQLKVPRLSGIADIIPVTVSDRIGFDITKDLQNETVIIIGEFRSYNRHDSNRSKLMLYVFVKEIIQCPVSDDMNNDIKLTGFVCKPTIYRVTPSEREITDILLAVNRPIIKGRNYVKSDYIPCICWGRNAVYAQTLQVSDCIEIYGRIQSREYEKKTDDNPAKIHTAYEVSITRITKCN